jgi:hypothetical protein
MTPSAPDGSHESHRIPRNQRAPKNPLGSHGSREIQGFPDLYSRAHEAALGATL